MIKSWSDEAWEDFEYWQGIGKPEPLKGDLSKYWSRRIDDCNRIVYCIENDTIKIVQCGSHYRDR